MRRRIFDQELFANCLTFSVERRRRLLDLNHPKRIVIGVLNEELEAFQARCIGHDSIPNPVHAVIWPSLPGQLSQFMKSWKLKSSYQIRDWYRKHAEEVDEAHRVGARFWQPKYNSLDIDNRQKLEEQLQYMPENPVRAGLVTRATDWRWSSARWNSRQQTAGIPIRWIE